MTSEDYEFTQRQEGILFILITAFVVGVFGTLVGVFKMQEWTIVTGFISMVVSLIYAMGIEREAKVGVLHE